MRALLIVAAIVAFIASGIWAILVVALLIADIVYNICLNVSERRTRNSTPEVSALPTYEPHDRQNVSLPELSTNRANTARKLNAVRRGWEAQGQRVGLINVETGEVFEPGE